MLVHIPKSQKPQKSQANKRKCPKCSGTSLSRSQRVDFIDRVSTLFNLYPYRCKQIDCNHRFQSHGRS